MSRLKPLRSEFSYSLKGKSLPAGESQKATAGSLDFNYQSLDAVDELLKSVQVDIPSAFRID